MNKKNAPMKFLSNMWYLSQNYRDKIMCCIAGIYRYNKSFPVLWKSHHLYWHNKKTYILHIFKWTTNMWKNHKICHIDLRCWQYWNSNKVDMVWADAMKWNLPQNLYYTCTKMELVKRAYYTFWYNLTYNNYKIYILSILF